MTFRAPAPADGTGVWSLVASCPPLDENSLYCNVLQCAEFADTCLLAERDGQVLGWVSGFRPPRSSITLFIWQVAVHPDAQGMGLGKRLLLALLDRPSCDTLSWIKTTISPGNDSSWALFKSVAQTLGAQIERQPYFDRAIHFSGRHASEDLVTIGPFRRDRRVRE